MQICMNEMDDVKIKLKREKRVFICENILS